MSFETDLNILAEQETLLRFPAFNADTAWALGSLLRARLVERAAGGTVEIELAGHRLFSCATPGAEPGQANWIRRKRNTVHQFAKSTYAVGRKLERDGATLSSKHGLPDVDYVAHGGGVPLLLKGTGMVGTVVLSGLPQRDDHNVVVSALAELLQIEIPCLL